MKRFIKILVVSICILIALVATMIVIGAFVLYSADSKSESFLSPAGLGEARFTRSGFGRDGPTLMTVEVRRSEDWSWRTVGRFQIFRGCPREFQEAYWSGDGRMLVVGTLYAGTLANGGYQEENGSTHVTAHAFDFHDNRMITPRDASPEAVDATALQIKELLGELGIGPEIPVFH